MHLLPELRRCGQDDFYELEAGLVLQLETPYLKIKAKKKMQTKNFKLRKPGKTMRNKITSSVSP